MGLCGRPGGDPNAWKHFGPEPAPGAALLGGSWVSEGFRKGNYGGGVRVGRHFGARWLAL